MKHSGRADGVREPSHGFNRRVPSVNPATLILPWTQLAPPAWLGCQPSALHQLQDQSAPLLDSISTNLGLPAQEMSSAILRSKEKRGWFICTGPHSKRALEPALAGARPRARCAPAVVRPCASTSRDILG